MATDATLTSKTMTMRERIASRVVQNVCELPDYTSPDDQPDLVMCKVQELEACVLRAFDEIEECSAHETTVMLPDGPAPFRPTDEVIRRVCLGGMRTTEEGREIITYLRWLERRQAVEAARRTDTRLAGDIEYCLAKISPATDVHAILTEVMKDLRSPEEPTPPQMWYCSNCKSGNRVDFHHTSCPACGKLRPAEKATALPPGSCTRCGDTGFLRIEGRTENCPTCNR